MGKNHVISWRKIREFIAEHPEDQSAEDAFARFYDILEKTPFHNVNDVKRTFSTASPVGTIVVFNIGGNKYRLTARFGYGKRPIYIRRVMTHGEYDKGGWQE